MRLLNAHRQWIVCLSFAHTKRRDATLKNGARKLTLKKERIKKTSKNHNVIKQTHMQLFIIISHIIPHDVECVVYVS